MSTTFTGANTLNKEQQIKTSVVKYKLRISLLFLTMNSTQSSKAKIFRDKQKYTDDNDISETLAQELSGSTIIFKDEDEESEYIIDDKTFVANENSPNGMKNLSISIDNYVRNFCLDDNIESITLCFFIPSVSASPIIPTLFFESFTPKCILKSEQQNYWKKINNQKSYIYYYGIDSIQSLWDSSYLKPRNGTNKPLTDNLIQIFALMSYYVYFYIDLLEQKDWSILKKNINIKEDIEKHIEKVIPTKPQHPSLWETAKNIANAIFSPIETVLDTFGLLFNYDGHLKNRIYNRIIDVVRITSPDDETAKVISATAINNILTECTNEGKPINMYKFYKLCNYWTYLGKFSQLEQFCKQWKVISYDNSFISGYGAILFSNGSDYVYSCKGTDFDSYGKDWLLSNLMQGISGFSMQHIIAISRAKELDKNITKTGGSLWFTGHSLGGGLASAATIATQHRIGVTFNAAGLNIIGIKINQLINNTKNIFNPNQSLNRVFPYRIKGEVLDTAQKTVLTVITINTLERGYGKKSVELDIDKKVNSCTKKHGINNFLYKEVINQLKPFNQITNENKTESGQYNKVISINFTSKNINSKVNLL